MLSKSRVILGEGSKANTGLNHERLKGYEKPSLTSERMMIFNCSNKLPHEIITGKEETSPFKSYTIESRVAQKNINGVAVLPSYVSTMSPRLAVAKTDLNERITPQSAPRQQRQ